MSSRKEAWDSNRPIYHSLPGLNGKYNENEPTNALTVYWDEKLISIKDKIDNIDLDPLTCPTDWIPLISYMTGFSGRYDISNYPLQAQRNILSKAWTFIWKYKGSEAVIDFILNELDIIHDFFKGNLLLADISTVPHILSSSELEYYIRLPLGYERDGAEFLAVKNVINLYSPAYVNAKICYDGFYADYSAAGDLLFEDKILSKKLGTIPEYEISGLKGWWSLKKTYTFYQGFCLKVIRLIDGVTREIGFVNNEVDTVGLLSFASGTTLAVEKIYDQSGEGFDLISNDTNKPIIVDNGVLVTRNSKPAILTSNSSGFDGLIPYYDTNSFTLYGIIDGFLHYYDSSSTLLTNDLTVDFNIDMYLHTLVLSNNILNNETKTLIEELIL